MNLTFGWWLVPLAISTGLCAAAAFSVSREPGVVKASLTRWLFVLLMSALTWNAYFLLVLVWVS